MEQKQQIDTDAYKEGYAAWKNFDMSECDEQTGGDAFVPNDINPYANGDTLLKISWLFGWQTADDDNEMLVQQKDGYNIDFGNLEQSHLDECPKCKSKNIKNSHHCFSVPEEQSYEMYCCSDCKCVWDIHYELKYLNHYILGEGDRDSHWERYGKMIEQGTISRIGDFVKPIDFKL